MTVTNAWQTFFGGTSTEILVGDDTSELPFHVQRALDISTAAANDGPTLDVRTGTGSATAVWSISGPITGAANLTKINTATLVLSGATLTAERRPSGTAF